MANTRPKPIGSRAMAICRYCHETGHIERRCKQKRHDASGPVPCRICGRPSKKRPRGGKLHYRHKCPHGNQCAAGDPLWGSHANRRGKCLECNIANGTTNRQGGAS